MKLIPLAIALVICTGLPALAQAPASTSGGLDELRGVIKVFVSRTVEPALEKKIAATIRKSLPHLTLVYTPEDAEIWLRLTLAKKYEWHRVPANPNQPGSVEGSSPDISFSLNAQVLRIKPIAPFSLIKESRRKGSDINKLAKSFASEFIEIYQQANRGFLPPPIISRTHTTPLIKDPETKPLTTKTFDSGLVNPANDVEVLRVDTNLITINVSVLDQEGKYVSTLKKEEFSLHDGGVKQELSYFATVDEPFTVALLIDTSRSVKFKIKDILTAANAFVGQLRADDRLIVVTFDSDIKEVVKSGRVAEVTKQGLSIELGGGSHTFLYDAVAFVLDEKLKAVRGRKAIVLLTDGMGDERAANSKSTLRDAEESETLIYSIQFDSFADAKETITGSGARRMLEAYRLLYEKGTHYLEGLARKTGGRFYQANDVSDFSQAFAAIVMELSNQYSLGYYPRPLPNPGEWRDIKVRVGVSNVEVRGRKKYLFTPR